MIELPELQGHLHKLSKQKWSKLFELLPEMGKPQEFGRTGGMEKLDDGTFSFPFSVPSEIVSKFFETVNELNIIPAFDWPDWNEGKQILRNREYDYNKLDAVTLCKLMTCIIRSDRFCDGALEGSFQNGTMQRIIRALENKFDI